MEQKGIWIQKYLVVELEFNNFLKMIFETMGLIQILKWYDPMIFGIHVYNFNKFLEEHF